MMVRNAVLPLLAAAIATVIVNGQEPSCPPTLDLSVEIDSSATLHYAIVPPYLCGRLEVDNDDAEGWIGLGFTENGMMMGSQAIIGIPAQGTVLKYDLTYVATPMENAKQTLTGTSIAVASIDGLVIMEFVKLMEEDGEVPIVIGENRFLQAKGPMELGYHTNGRISTTITLEGSDGAVITDDVENETVAPTYASSNADTPFGTTPVPSPVDAPAEDVSVDAPAEDISENTDANTSDFDVPVDIPAENPPPAGKSDGTMTWFLPIKISFSITWLVVLW